MRVVVLPDLQIPFQDNRFVNNLLDFVYKYQPDELFCVGDEADCTEPARWSKATAEEFAPTLHKNLKLTSELMTEFSNRTGNAPFHISRSNHLDRLETYIRRYAPAFQYLDVLKIECLLGYDRMPNVTYHRWPYEFARGWLLCHGDEGSTVRTPGGTALSLARKFGKSVVCGHTHRAGIQPESASVNGRVTRTLYGIEVGHAMDLKQATYLRGNGAANWQQAFGILHIDGSTVSPQLVYAQRDRSFVVDGVTYG